MRTIGPTTFNDLSLSTVLVDTFHDGSRRILSNPTNTEISGFGTRLTDWQLTRRWGRGSSYSVRRRRQAAWSDARLHNVLRHTGMVCRKWMLIDDSCTECSCLNCRRSTMNHQWSRCLPVWLSDNTLVSINVVTLHQARLVPGWAIVFGQVSHLGAEPGTQVCSA